MPHDEPLKALLNDGCEYNRTVVVEDTEDFFVGALRHIGTVVRERLKMSVMMSQYQN